MTDNQPTLLQKLAAPTQGIYELQQRCATDDTVEQLRIARLLVELAQYWHHAAQMWNDQLACELWEREFD